MRKEDQSYLMIILFHILIGFMGYAIPFTTKIYGYGIFLYGIYYVIKNQNRNNEALLAAAYIVGSEVFLRMTDGNPLYEISKYAVMVFVLIGMYYSGFSKGAAPYWIFILLLVPGIILATVNLNFDTDMRKAIAFNISGPVCLGVASLYTFRRKISIAEMNRILLWLGLPIISCMVYLAFYTPSIKDVITSTESNFQTSGGYGPNQVATILGLGTFVFVSRIILDSKTKLQILINTILA